MTWFCVERNFTQSQHVQPLDHFTIDKFQSCVNFQCRSTSFILIKSSDRLPCETHEIDDYYYCLHTETEIQQLHRKPRISFFLSTSQFINIFFFFSFFGNVKTIETEKNFHENIRNNVASLTWVFCVCFSKKDNAAEENKLKTIYTYVEGSTYIIYKLCSLISSFVCSKRFSTLVFCSRFSQFIQEWFENTHCQHPKVIAFGNWSKCCCSPVTTHTRRSTPNKNPPKITIINK